ncbi:MAG: Rrf2 family transcriptional regulator [Balneolaceae bacterium]|nr:MAG: Rrf2 family transcriptional regulator [Balneolaceae bacterium]
MFSASCHYGLQAMLYIAKRSAETENIELNEISESQQIPKFFLSKILQQLVKGKLLVSMRGPNGGFRLNGSPRQICLIDVIRIIDGLDIFDQCGIGDTSCNPKDYCPIHEEFSKQRECVFRLFSETSLGCLSDKKSIKQSFN